jgi:hypothetical protein
MNAGRAACAALLDHRYSFQEFGMSYSPRVLRPLWLLLALSPLCADVTLRYKSEVKLNSSLPPEMAAQAMKGMGEVLPSDTVLQLKEGKGYSSVQGLTSISDFMKQMITFVDASGKRYATLPVNQLATEMAAAMPAIPPEAKAAMASIKSSFESRLTGRSAEIQGIQAEEREIVMSVEGPAVPNMPPGPMMRMVMQFWTAKSSEAARVPAIRELKGYNLWSNATMNPAESMRKMFDSMPGFADGFGSFVKEMQSGSPVVLRIHMEMFMPGIAAMLKRMPAGTNSPFGANFDADAAFMQMNQELVELSTAAVPDSIFQVPADFKSVPVGDILKDRMAKAQAAMKQ